MWQRWSWLAWVIVACGSRTGLQGTTADDDEGGRPSTGGASSTTGGVSSNAGAPNGAVSAGGALAGGMSAGGTIAGGVGLGGTTAGGALVGGTGGVVTAGAGGALVGGTGGVVTAGAGGAGSDAGGASAGAGGASAGAGGGAGSDAGAGGVGGAGEAPRLAVEVVAGAFHSCVRFDDGSLRCWGGAQQNGLGLNRVVGDDETPAGFADVDIGGRVAQLAAGWYHSCALLQSGRLRCFGNGGYGMLGYGNQADIGDDEAPASAGDVDVGARVLQVAVGPYHTCAVVSGGRVRCWGKNDHFQLGYASPGSIGDDELPSIADFVDVGGRVKQVAAGFEHTCALLETGKVRCWGTSVGGQLGYGKDGIIGDDESPASAGDVDVGGVVSQIVAGAFHTCALLVSGKVRCWGRSYDGRLGYGNTQSIGDDESPASAGDVDVGGLVTQLSAGDYATCALLVGGKVRCWGSGDEGELGYASTQNVGDTSTPASAGDVDVGGGVTQLDVGFLHVCAILEGGAVRCWGRAATGELGYGNIRSIGDTETPASVGDVPVR